MRIIKKVLDSISNYRHNKVYRSLGINNSEITRLKNETGTKQTYLFGKKIVFTNFFWYVHGLNEIFLEKTYQFNSEKESPLILDCGANIGLSAIFFKNIYPKAKIIAFEADADIAEILRSNLHSFNLNDVQVVPKAAWTENTVLSFKSDGAVGGKISENGKGTIKIDAVRLKEYLVSEIDFLKIDIEGVEYDILMDCAENLDNVNNIFIEYHSFLNKEQKLDEILSVLKKAGFKYYIKEAWNNMPIPYIDKRMSYYDLQLNIFGYRL